MNVFFITSVNSAFFSLLTFICFSPSSARMESCLDWCKCCFWRFLLTSQNSWEWPREENSGRLSKRCELELAFLRSDCWPFAFRVELNKTILLLPRKEHFGHTSAEANEVVKIVFDFKLYLKVQRFVDISCRKAIPKRLQMIRLFPGDISEDICFR